MGAEAETLIWGELDQLDLSGKSRAMRVLQEVGTAASLPRLLVATSVRFARLVRLLRPMPALRALTVRLVRFSLPTADPCATTVTLVTLTRS